MHSDPLVSAGLPAVPPGYRLVVLRLQAKGPLVPSSRVSHMSYWLKLLDPLPSARLASRM